MRQRANSSIPEKKLRQYEVLRRLARDQGTTPGERASAERRMREVETLYPGIETHFVQPAPAPTRGRHPAPVKKEWAPKATRARDWVSLLPGLNMKPMTAFVGVRMDGQIDLFLKDTYEATLPAPDAAAYLIEEHIHSLLDEALRVAAVHFVILAVESKRQYKIMRLPEFEKLIGFRYRPGSPPHLPPEGEEDEIGPDDFE